MKNNNVIIQPINKIPITRLLKSSTPDSVIGYYLYGSIVYGVAGPKSDYDFIVVDRDQVESEIQKKEFPVDYNLYSEKKFKQMLEEHDIAALECMFLHKDFVIKNEIQTPKLDLTKLRSSVSKTASNSFVKCKKKLEVEKEYHIGKKSLWHSLRIIMFGTQIARHRRIIDYSEANYLWDEIVLCDENNWEYYKEKYKPLYNKLMTEFRKVAPKAKR